MAFYELVNRVTVQPMRRGCITNCPAHSSTPWNVLLIVVISVAFLALVIAVAKFANWRDDEHRAGGRHRQEW